MSLSARTKRVMETAFADKPAADEVDAAIDLSSAGAVAAAVNQVLVGQANGFTSPVAMSGDVAIDATGATTIQAGAVTSSKLDSAITQYAAVALTSAQIKALRATPIQVVAAVAGKIPEFMSAELIYDFGTTAYTITAGGDDLAFKINNGAGVAVSETVETTGFVDQVADMVEIVRGKTGVIATGANANGASIVIHNIGANELTLGDGVMRIKVAYRMHTSGL